MRKLFLLFLVFTPFVNAQDYGMSETDFEMLYPLPKDGKWCFSSSPDSALPVSTLYDTIHFCPTPFGVPNFLAVKGSEYYFLSPCLEEISQGLFSRFLFHDDHIYIKRPSDWLSLDVVTNEEQSIQADSIVVVDHILYLFKGGKTGLIEYDTKIPAIYDRVIEFSDPNDTYIYDLYLVLNEGKFGLVNELGEVVLEPIASIVQHEDFGILKYKEGTWKYILPSGKTVSPNEREIHFFSDKLYKVYNSSRTKATLYKDEEVVTKAEYYDDIFQVGGFYGVRKNEKIGLLNASFNLIKRPFCDQIDSIADGRRRTLNVIWITSNI